MPGWITKSMELVCIPCHLELINSIYHLISILIHGLLLHGIRKETTRFMFPWMFLYKTFAIVAWIPTAMILYKVIVNCFWPNHFDISRADGNLISLYVIVSIYGEWVEKIYESIKEKEKGQFDEITNIEEGKETNLHSEGARNHCLGRSKIIQISILLSQNTKWNSTILTDSFHVMVNY